MKLWTIQDKEIADFLRAGNTYRCDPQEWRGQSMGSGFPFAYDYMIEQMGKRGIEQPQGVDFPLWAWHTSYGKRQKPDLRQHRYACDDNVLIGLDIDPQRVLLSDFMEWHCVLNNCAYIGPEEEDWEKFDNLSEAEARKTWDNIFVLREYDEVDIQACFWELRPDDVSFIQQINRKRVPSSLNM